LQVGQLFDNSLNVPWTALDLLDEACDDKMNLEAVVCAMGESFLKLPRYTLAGFDLMTHTLTRWRTEDLNP
jgi:hypothetical protein